MLKRSQLDATVVLWSLTVILPLMLAPSCTDVAVQGYLSDAVVGVTPAEGYALIDQEKDNPDFVILDVRTPEEYAAGHIPGAVRMCYTCAGEFQSGLASFDKDATYLVYCRTGNRSRAAVIALSNAGFTDIYHLEAGITQWIAEGYEIVPSE